MTKAQSLPAQCAGGSAGLVTNATSSVPNVTVEFLVPTVSVGITPSLPKPVLTSAEEFGLACEYFRERKKRGKASWKDLAEQQSAASTTSANRASPNEYSSEGPSPMISDCGSQGFFEVQSSSIRELPPPPVPLRSMSSSDSGMTLSTGHQGLGTFEKIKRTNNSTARHSYKIANLQHQQMFGLQQILHPEQQVLQVNQNLNRETPIPISLNNFDLVPGHVRPGVHSSSSSARTHSVQPESPSQPLTTSLGTVPGHTSYAEEVYPHINPPAHHPLSNYSYTRNSEGSLNSMMTASPANDSPGWLSMPSPSASTYHNQRSLNAINTLRYPVLRPLLPSIAGIIPTTLACELLELYFTSVTSAYMRPLSPYLLGYVFRRQSFLNPTKPRVCSPALLCSMLWVAAQTSNASFLTSLPATRGRICQKLLELTVSLLRPLIHNPTRSEASMNYGTSTVVEGIALGGLGVAVADGNNAPIPGEVPGALDAVATYIHLATVVSASEYKAASLRWWNAAWSLARELKLGRELPPNPPQQMTPEQSQGDDADADGDVDIDMAHLQPTVPLSYGSNPSDISTLPAIVSEEEREERRRIWWLLYTMDRHLGLCYNRPLFLLDIECEGLFQPVDDLVWQAGEFYNGYPVASQYHRRRGPQYECTGHSIFGYFTPLMTILGEIVDLHHARNHPRFGIGLGGTNDWDNRIAVITQQLEIYGRSLKEFQARQCANIHTGGQVEADYVPANPFLRTSTSNICMAESILQTKTVVAYGMDVMHVLHILLAGKWDPISLLDDNDLWISSQSFITATGHAVSAAEAISDILEYDPDLSFMPFFLGIYLLQGSFLLLLIADKLQGEANPSVVKACETIVRAHEACIVTLNTEYQVSFSTPFLYEPKHVVADIPQRNFRRVMRSALAQVKGRGAEEFGEQQQRRRELLSLYRWTGDGRGLAL